MEKTINNEVTNNKRCIININNIENDKDPLNPYNVYSEMNKNPLNIERELNKRAKYASSIYDLPEELKEFFEVKPKAFGEKIRFTTVPKNKEAIKKYPYKFNITYNPNSITNKADFSTVNNLDVLLKESYMKQKPIVIEDIKQVKEFIGNFENPFPILKDSNNNPPSKVVFIPEKLPKMPLLNIYLYNEDIELNINNILFDVEKIDRQEGEPIITLSNYSQEDKMLRIKLVLTNNSTTINVEIDEKYINNCYARLDYCKYEYLSNKKDTNILITYSKTGEMFFSVQVDESTHHYIENKKFIEKEIELLEKLVFIEKRTGTKFKYDIKKLFEETLNINILCSYLKREKYETKQDGKLTFNKQYVLTKNIMEKDIVFILDVYEVMIFNKKFKLDKYQAILLKNNNLKIIKKDDKIIVPINKIVYQPKEVFENGIYIGKSN